MNTPIEPTSPDGVTTSSSACAPSQYAALAARVLAIATSGLRAAGAADLRRGLGDQVDEPARAVDVDQDRADVVVVERVAEVLAEALQAAAAEPEEHREQRRPRRDHAAERDHRDRAAAIVTPSLV
jgi:hypothetical protein